ncbi:MAG: acetyl-CoA carboxylase biotin carboxyl carrier protein [Candidatus Limnocylindrus sp.]
MPHDTERLGDLLDSLVPVLIDRLHETGLGEIEIERDGATVRVRAEELAAPVAAAPAASAPRGGTPVAAAAAPTVADDRRHPVRSTAVGFVKLAPDIHVGGKVAKGSLVATVDVLGVAVDVRADHAGIVAKLRCATGDPVEYGQELFLLESVGEVKA